MRRRRVVVGALLALALVCSTASAQLPELPTAELAPLPKLPNAGLAPVAPEAIPQLPRAPLPGPVADVVDGAPAIPAPELPATEQMRRLVGGAVEASGVGTARASAATNGDAAQPGAAAAPPGPAGSATPTGGSSGTRAPGGRQTRGRRRERRIGEAAADSRTFAARPSEGVVQAAARRRSAEADGDGSPLTRTIREIVQVVPDAVWVALAALLALALGLGARSLVDRRRARALELERERLLRDVGLLERALLPAVPERLGALSASVAYRSAAGPGAGGDFYDAFELAAGRAAILVGDVSGHGPAALERTGSMRSTLHACLEAGMSPRAALESATRGWADDSGGCFATVVVAVHDPATGTLTYAGAGHPPPILVGPAVHEPITIAGAPPIGVGIRTGLRQTTVPLTRGSIACFFTDGLLEARAGDELIGRERLAAIVEELGPDDRAEALLEQVIADADEAPDDMTACLVRAELGGEAVAPRLEELELDADELELGVGERFLTACGVPAHAGATALEEARSIAAMAGAAVLLVTLDESVRRVRIEAPGNYVTYRG